MDVNPTDQTCRNPVKPIRRARFRSGPVACQAPAETLTYNGECKNCLEMTCKCSSGTSKAAPGSSSQTQRSDLFGVCLNCPCPLDNRKSCGSCSAISAASLDRSTVVMTGGPAARDIETLEEVEGSVYNGRSGGFTGFKKPSTTTAMSMPGAEEATVYNGKIFSGDQWRTNRTATATPTNFAVRNEAIFDESIHGGGLISFGKFQSGPSPSIHTTGVATEEGSTSVMYDKTSHDRLGRSKRSRQEKDIQFGSASFVMGTSVPEYSMQSGVESDQTVLFNEAGTSGQLPAPAHPRSSSCHKRSKTERICVRVPAVNSEVPPGDGYTWWKYGQKSIKGSSYPRNYYQCKTHRNCAAKKLVMRALDEPAMLDITYNGEHSAMSDTATHPAASSSILPSTSAATADIVPGNVPAAPLEEPTTANPRQFFKFL